MIALLVALGLGGTALAFVLYPLYRKDKQAVSETAMGTSNAVAEREQAARAALQEVELDYQLDNISEEDYNSLRERYMRRALVALRSRYQREQELDEAIEARLREMKERGEHETG
jgi:hypothetical protein